LTKGGIYDIIYKTDYYTLKQEKDKVDNGDSDGNRPNFVNVDIKIPFGA